MDGRRQYQSALRKHNRQLKSLAAYLGLKENLTSYLARHSWATIAYHSGVEVSLVSEAMGHHTEEITRVYLSSFEHKRLAEANRIVLNAILRPVRKEWVEPVSSTPDSQNEYCEGMIRPTQTNMVEIKTNCRKFREKELNVITEPEKTKNVRHLGGDGR